MEIINIRQLREQMPRVVQSVRRGQRFLVLHRCRPAFELAPPGAVSAEPPPVDEDPVYKWTGVGASQDGLRAAEHDRLLYGA